MAAVDDLRAAMLARVATVCGGLLLSLVTWLAAMIYADVRTLSAQMAPALQAARMTEEHGRELSRVNGRLIRLEVAAGIGGDPGAGSSAAPARAAP